MGIKKILASALTSPAREGIILALQKEMLTPEELESKVSASRQSILLNMRYLSEVGAVTKSDEKYMLTEIGGYVAGRLNDVNDRIRIRGD